MKKLFYTGIVLFLLIAGGFLTGCQRTTSPTVIGKWTLVTGTGNYTINGVNYKDTIRFTPADYFDIKSDGTLTIVETGKTYNGKWVINNSKLVFTETNYIDFPGGFDIPVLSDTELQLFYASTTPSTYSEQTLNFVK